MAVIDLDTLSVSANGTLPSVPFLDIKNEVLGKNYILSIAFVSPQIAQALNIKHRNKDYIPNTLSFALDAKNGEIVLCRSAIRKQYKDFDMDYETYLTFLLIHSMLHLKGYDHGSTMEKAEARYLARLAPHQ